MVMVGTTDTTIKTNSATSGDKEKAIADFDTFLKLLTAQLKNQDPLNPQDGTEFTSQLAQFSSLEQQINTNEHLKELIAAQPDTKQAEAMSYIGKDVLIPGDKFKLGEAGNIEFTYDVNMPMESATAAIFNAEGDKVREFNVDATDGIHDVIWDGRDAEGNRLDSGIYTIKVTGHGAKGENGELLDPKLTTYLYSRAEKVTKLGDTYAVLTSDGRSVNIDKVISARESTTTNNSNAANHATALQMLGKQILIPGSDFKFSGNNIGFTYGITKDIQAVSVTIFDSEGNKIKQVPFESSKGSHEYIWDGTDSNGDKVPEGEYSIKIVGQDVNDDGEINEQGLDTFYYGTATKVEAQNGIVLIYTEDGRKAFYEEIITTKD